MSGSYGLCAREHGSHSPPPLIRLRIRRKHLYQCAALNAAKYRSVLHTHTHLHTYYTVARYDRVRWATVLITSLLRHQRTANDFHFFNYFYFVHIYIYIYLETYLGF